LGSSKRRFLGVQRSSHIYFGENTPFGGREREIYDYFFTNLSRPPAPGYTFPKNEKTLPRIVIRSLLGATLKYISPLTVNPYCQYWRANEYAAKIVHSQPDLDYRFDRKRDLRQLALSFCPIEWGWRHAEQFDPLIAPVVHEARALLTEVNPALRDAYEITIEEMLEQYVEDTAAGGRISACVRYQTNAQLQAMLPLLWPATRYPKHLDQPEGLVLALPPTSDSGFRISRVLVENLWRVGFVPDRVIELDDRTLFVQARMPLFPEDMIRAVAALCHDATRLEERIKARPAEPSDEVYTDDVEFNDVDYAQGVYFVEPMHGRWRVGNLEISSNKVFHAGGDARINRLVESGEPAEEFLPKILKSDYARIKKSGESFDHYCYRELSAC
jgi:hypothetical protein